MKMIFPLMAMVSFLLPALLALVCIRRTGARKRAVLVGMLTFFVFVFMLEAPLNNVLLAGNGAFAGLIMSNPVLYGLYGGLAAGIFEECGRYFAFKTLLRKCDGRETAIAYGIGHGGMEVIMLLGLNYTIYSIAAFSHSETFAVLLPTLEAIMAAPGMCLVALLERIFALLLQVSLSVLVFYAARDRAKLCYLPLAIILHALIDFPAGLCQKGMISVAVLECIVCVYAVATAFFAWKIYKAMGNKNAEE